VRHLTLMRTEVVALAGEITGTLSLASLPSVTATLVARNCGYSPRDIRP
jgi:hypothetical protein